MNHGPYSHKTRFSNTPPAPIVPKASFNISFHDDDGSVVSNIVTSDHASLPRLITNWMSQHPFGGVHIINS